MSPSAGNDLAAILRDSVTRALREQVTPALLRAAEGGDFAADLWQLCRELGLDGVLVPEEHGGAGGSWQDARLVVRACGEYLAPVPVPEALVGRWLLRSAGIDQPDGLVTLVPAPLHIGADGHLTGRAERVPFGRHAHWLVGSAAGRDSALVIVPAAGMAWHRGSNLAGEPRDSVALDGADHSCLPAAHLPAGMVAYLGALLRATQIAGAGASLLAQSLRYAGERTQFGRPLARFQVIQHNLAKLAEAVAAVEAVTALAWRTLDTAPPGRRWNRDSRLLVAAAKVTASELVETIAGVAHQVHGAIGFTHEHTLHFATRRLWSWRAEFGTDSHWAEQLGALAIRRGGMGIWADITAVTDA